MTKKENIEDELFGDLEFDDLPSTSIQTPLSKDASLTKKRRRPRISAEDSSPSFENPAGIPVATYPPQSGDEQPDGSQPLTVSQEEMAAALFGDIEIEPDNKIPHSPTPIHIERRRRPRRSNIPGEASSPSFEHTSGIPVAAYPSQSGELPEAERPLGSEEEMAAALFGDIEEEPAPKIPHTPTPVSVFTETMTQTGSLQVPGAGTTRSRQRTTSALKKMPDTRPRPRIGLILILVLLLAGSAVGALYIMKIGPFEAIPQVKRTKILPSSGANVLIDSQPKGASISIDGNELQQKTPYRFRLEPGREYIIRTRLGEYTRRRRTQISADVPLYKFMFKLGPQTAPIKDGGAAERRGPDVKVTDANTRLAGSGAKGTQGTLELTCEPKGAVVTLMAKGNDAPLVNESCPLTKAPTLEPGNYRISIQKKGYIPYKDEVTIKALGKLNLTVKLPEAKEPTVRRAAPVQRRKVAQRRRVRRRRRKGTVVFKTTPAVDVYWKGKKIGRTPLRYQLPSGRHRITYRDRRKGIYRIDQVRIRSGRTKLRNMIFSKATLKFYISPWGNVWINGKKVGQAPMPPQKVYEGRHSITIKMGKLTHKTTVRVYPYQTKKVRHTFRVKR